MMGAFKSVHFGLSTMDGTPRGISICAVVLSGWPRRQPRTDPFPPHGLATHRRRFWLIPPPASRKRQPRRSLCPSSALKECHRSVVYFDSLVGGGRGTDPSSLLSLVPSCSFLWFPKTTLKKPAKKGPSRSTSRVIFSFLLIACCAVTRNKLYLKQ
ncbi:hypothetical protein OPV22_022601 [Ensete ventricosum]|uniref:Uncharacterized protein n=1 Tax=Ensete ventricosum TaxID=4639 RepID=A0AAV8QPT3_ENSVE|nr:hypothetical protein OPV22_022601 [Ensete ventricosum]